MLIHFHIVLVQKTYKNNSPIYVYPVYEIFECRSLNTKRGIFSNLVVSRTGRDIIIIGVPQSVPIELKRDFSEGTDVIY